MNAPTDFTEYLNWTEEQLLNRLARLAQNIGTARKDLAFAKSSAEKDKADALRSSQESSVTARSQSARVSSLAATMQVMEFEGLIAEQVEEQAFLRDLLAVKRVSV